MAPRPKTKRIATLTIRKDLLAEARALRLNISRAAEAGIAAAVKDAKEVAWVKDSQAAIQAYNKRVSSSGLALTGERPES